MKYRRVVPESIYPIVSELDPRVRPEALPFNDWSELSSTRRPGAVIFDATGVASHVDERGIHDGALFGGTGEKLLRHCDSVFAESQEIVFGIEDMDLWRWQRPELRNLLEQFFGPFAKLPCLAYAHLAAWSRRTIHRAIFPGDVLTSCHRPPPVEVEKGSPVTLGFEFDGEDDMTMSPDELLWADPAGVDPEELCVAKLVEAPRLVLGVDIVKPFHRQRIGRTAPIRRNPALRHHGVFPAIAERLRPVSRRASDGRIVVGATDGQLLDEAGILDALILRLRRYHPLETNGAMLVDEMAISFERFTGRVLEITTERESSGPGEVSPNFEEGVFGRWLNDQL